MGFYEDDRIRNKQLKYLISRAECKISALKQQGLSGARLLSLLKSRSEDTSLNETEREIYKVATKLTELL